MTRYTLHVPAVLNDGALVALDVIDRIEARLLDIAGGFTLTDGFGAWRAPDGTVYREPVRVYVIDTETPEYVAHPLRLLAEWIALELEQEAVYVTHAEITAQLVARPSVLA